MIATNTNKQEMNLQKIVTLSKYEGDSQEGEQLDHQLAKTAAMPHCSQ